jgi:hypothetical protein
MKMLKKAVVLTVVCLLLLVTAAPVAAMLKVLEPKLSEELREVAKTHLVRTENIAGDAIDIQEGWVQEYWNIGVDVYNVVAVIDKGLATERKVQIPVRVDRKVVLSDAELVALEKEDKALAPDEPVMRILLAPDEAGTGNQPVEQPGAEPAQAAANYSAAEAAQAETAGYTIYYLAAGAITLLLMGTAYALRRCRA